MLKNNFISNVRDRIHVTPLIYVVTYFVLFYTQFNVVDILIQCIESLTNIRNLNFHKKPNLALSHLITYILEVKYNISYLSTSNHTPHLTNYSLHII